MHPERRPAHHRRGGPVDDRAAARAQVRMHGFRTEERALQIDRHHPVPLLDRDLKEWLALERGVEPGIVDEGIDAPKRLRGAPGHGQTGGFVGDIDRERDRTAALTFDQPDGLFRAREIVVCDPNLRARLGEAQRERAP